jgi:hypothetical protein
MRKNNNMSDHQNQTENALNEDTLIFVVSVAIVSFALGFAVASALAAAQIAAMLAAQ